MTKFSTITLSENFRSGRAICRAAEKLISHNHGGKIQPIKAMRDVEGIVATRVFENERAEERFVLAHVADLIYVENGTEAAKTNENPNETRGSEKPSIAILCRTNPEVQKWSDALLNDGFKIGTRNTGRENLPEGWEKLRATIGFFASPENQFLARKFLLTVWSNDQVEKALKGAVAARKSLNQFAVNFPVGNVATDPATVRRFMDSKTSVPLATVDWLCERLKDLPSGISFADLSLYLMELESGGQRFPADADVIVSTVHSVKSLEFDAVCVVGMNEGFFPRGNDELQESRRLFYVALTRARDSILITASRTRWTKWNGILNDVPESRFLKEIL